MSKTAYWSAENVNENENKFSEETNEFDFFLENNCRNCNENNENAENRVGVQDFHPIISIIPSKLTMFSAIENM